VDGGGDVFTGIGLAADLSIESMTASGDMTVHAWSGSVVLTQVSPSFVGSFDVELFDADGGALGTLCGSIDAAICTQ
jgi:hypothetical protein